MSDPRRSFSQVDVDVVCPKCESRFTEKFEKVYIDGGLVKCPNPSCSLDIELIVHFEPRVFEVR